MHHIALAALVLIFSSCATTGNPSHRPDTTSLVAAEVAFSDSMKERDFQAFTSFIAPDAVFINGGKPLRGKQAILTYWKRFFDSSPAPFSWRPEIAEISSSDGLGYTEGPVTASDTIELAKFYSVWKLQEDGSWRVIFDNGYDICKK